MKQSTLEQSAQQSRSGGCVDGSPPGVSHCIACIVLLVAGMAAPARLSADDNDQTPGPVNFARDVLPMLKRSCYTCHSGSNPDSGYRLDQRSAAHSGGDSGQPAIVPHKPRASALFLRVSSTESAMRMPPEEADVPSLSSEEIETLRQWIISGPDWPDEFAGDDETTEAWWSLSPLTRPDIPSTTTQSHPIDAFVAEKLKSSNLKFSPPADHRTLLRRVSYSLIGLPPTADDVANFAGDDAACENAIDALLASPRYGEHWARHWLDIANYADTHGNDHDYFRPNAWPYRDYVINALNHDKPYQSFVQEQIAGDVMFPADPQATVALGFLAAGPWDHTLMAGIREDTVDHLMSQNLDRDVMVTTVMSAFQSLTVHCARCHNHKFDPISQQEYYALQAVFAGADRADRPYDPDPNVFVRRRKLRARMAAVEARDANVRRELTAADQQEWLKNAEEQNARRPHHWKPLSLVSATTVSGGNTIFTKQADDSWLVSGDAPEKETYLITAQLQDQDVRAIRIEALPDPSLPGNGPGRYHPSGNFHLSELRIDAHPAGGNTTGTQRVQFSGGAADQTENGAPISHAFDNNAGTHWSIHPAYGQPHEAVFDFTDAIGFPAGTTLVIRMEFSGATKHQLGRFRLSYCTGDLPYEFRHPHPAAITNLLKKNVKERTDSEQLEIGLAFLKRNIEAQLAELPPPKMVYAATSSFTPEGSFKPSLKPRPVYLLKRGDVLKPGPAVEPAALRCLSGLDSRLKIDDPEDEAQRRAALALWLTADDNVLTWRSIVNRVWHYHFGCGLVNTPDDFGRMGGTPSHPELLDWLAVWFRDEARGSLKMLHRLILTSRTYRQAVAHSERASAVDPQNRLLWRMNRRRLSGEQLRDSLLQLSGRIDLTMGGSSAVQFVDHGHQTFRPDGGAPPVLDYISFDPDAPPNRRRAIYRFLFRTVPDPLMDAFDVPDGGSLTPRRSESTTALQAFALLNNQFVIRQAEHIAALIRQVEAGSSHAAEMAFRHLLLRDPGDRERDLITKYADDHGLANLIQVLLNSNEFIYVD